MIETISTTRWRDEPITPENYDDIAALVRVARKARNRTVEFEWVFTREDLPHLRRAVYEWGSRVQGCYKGFDSRVLAAINAALGEMHSVFVLNAPKGTQGMDCAVACVKDGDVFRLRGHATFAIVFGYGLAGCGKYVVGSQHLVPSVQETLISSVRMLNWDIERLQEERLRPAINALYGLRLDYAVHVEQTPPSEPRMDVSVHFHGPFSATDSSTSRCLFTDELATSGGVYLWTVRVDGQERPWYVGQTRRGFAERIAEHVACYLSGEYTICDPVALARGEYRGVAGIDGAWPQTLPAVLRNYHALAPHIMGLIRLLKFHVAPLSGDARLHNRVEGAVGRYYQNNPDRTLRDFFGPGLKLPAAVPYDKPIRLLLSSDTPLAGLPPEILEG